MSLTSGPATNELTQISDLLLLYAELAVTDRQKWLEKFVEEFMFNDVQACINGRANFTAALALSVYTDALGGLVNGKLTEEGVSRENYSTFLKMMGYNDSECQRYFKEVRSGLVHQYFIKGQNTIVIESDPTLKGIYETGGIIFFIVRNYFEEFKKSYSKYKSDLLAGDTNLQSNFDKALAGEEIPESVRKGESPKADAAAFGHVGISLSANVEVRNPTTSCSPPSFQTAQPWYNCNPATAGSVHPLRSDLRPQACSYSLGHRLPKAAIVQRRTGVLAEHPA